MEKKDCSAEKAVMVETETVTAAAEAAAAAGVVVEVSKTKKTPFVLSVFFLET